MYITYFPLVELRTAISAIFLYNFIESYYPPVLRALCYRREV